jgi:hypothetical protein
MQVRVDKARYGEFTGTVNFAIALVCGMRTNNPVTHNGNIGFSYLTGDDIKQSDIAQDQIGLDPALTGQNAFAKMGLGKVRIAHDHFPSFFEILLWSKGKACGGDTS